jgi:phage-related baseplate assembly protein
MTGTKRLTATHAQTTLRFTLDHPVEVGNYQIPAGTIVSNGQHIFKTDELLIIPAGEQSGTVIATAEKEGTASNGILPGFVTQLATPLPNLTVTNITTTNGGADAESDEDFAERISLAPETFASAGPRQAYIGHAMAAHPDIAAVSVTAPRPGVVDVRPILKNGELPSEEILELVRTALNDESVRPLTDTVIVASPDPEEYEINVEWSIAKSDEALVATIKQQVAQAIETYRLWQRTMPGRDINPTKLISLMEQAGARYVHVISPTFKTLTQTKIAIETSVQSTYLGSYDE